LRTEIPDAIIFKRRVPEDLAMLKFFAAYSAFAAVAVALDRLGVVKVGKPVEVVLVCGFAVSGLGVLGTFIAGREAARPLVGAPPPKSSAD
jgi:hypothetical protein